MGAIRSGGAMITVSKVTGALEYLLSTSGELDISVTVGDIVNTIKKQFTWNTPIDAGKSKFSGWIDTQGLIAGEYEYAWLLAVVKTDKKGDLYIVQSDVNTGAVQFQDKQSLILADVIVDPSTDPPITASMYKGAFRVAISKRYVGAVLVNTDAAIQTVVDFSVATEAI